MYWNLLHDAANEAPEFPPVNVWTGPDDYVLTARIPGLNAADLDVTVTGDTLTIKGSRQPKTLSGSEGYHRQERGYGRFVRSFRLASHVDASRVEASYLNGVLKVTLPRSEASKPRKITLKSAN